MILSGKGCELMIPECELKDIKEIERSIIKKYRKHLWSPFMRAIRDFQMIQENDRIAVTISGGKGQPHNGKAVPGAPQALTENTF